MIIIPEIQKVLILVPRAASTSLQQAVLAKYPEAINLYRHMEACAIPKGYSNWESIGIIREPLERLWSLYWYLQSLNTRGHSKQEWVDAQYDAVRCKSFEWWLLTNEHPFNTPWNGNEYCPFYMVTYPMAENKKSQRYYLLDCDRVIPMTQLHKAERLLELDPLPKSNEASPGYNIPVTERIKAHMEEHFSWDTHRYKELTK